MTGFCIVFLGVILYKLVFHLEKEEKKAQQELMSSYQKVLLQKDEYGDGDGTRNGNDDYNDDKEEEISFELVDRATGLVDRHPSKESSTSHNVDEVTQLMHHQRIV